MGLWVVRLGGCDLGRGAAAGVARFGVAGVVGSGGSLAAVGVEVVAVQVGDAEGQVQ